MSCRAKSVEQRIDAYISSAPRDALVRLQSEVSAALKYRVFPAEAAMNHFAETQRTRNPKDAAQMPLAKGAE